MDKNKESNTKCNTQSNKSNTKCNTKIVSLRLPNYLAERLKSSSDKQGISANKWVINLLSHSLLNETELFQSLSVEEQQIFLTQNHFKRLLPSLKELLEQHEIILQELPKTVKKQRLLDNLRVIKSLLLS